MLNDMLSQLKRSGATARNVVYLGAGTCPDFQRINDFHPGCIVLVEANKYHVAELKSAHGWADNLVVLENLVIADGEGREAELLVTNLPAYSSIFEPSGLSHYYPSIKVVRRDRVPAITLSEICDRLAIGSETNSIGAAPAKSQNVLIVDLPGYEAKIIGSVSPAVLGNFDLILCRSATESVYTGAESYTEVEKAFHRHHFTTDVIRELAHPFVVLRAVPGKLSRMRSELSELKKKNEELECELVSVQAQLQRVQVAEQNLTAGLERIQADNTALRAEKEDLSTSNRIIGKTLLKTQTDLDDLRTQYHNLKQAKARQNGVMMQVAQRLDRASEQYIKLVEKYPELREFGEAVLVPMETASEAEVE
uniref:hypothetical protein n=1 Tax=Microbulbifer agarilyticus TaxID=260552 RepID=UPI000255B93B|nr:hypothetical protein [Microbulbifer agarilyticus]